MTTKNILILLGAVLAIVVVVLITKPKKDAAVNNSQTDSITGDTVNSSSTQASTSLDSNGDVKGASSTKAPGSEIPTKSPTFPKTGFEPKN